MSRKAEYSDKYSFYNSSISFDLGGNERLKSHGTLSTSGIDGAQPRRFTSERNIPNNQNEPLDQISGLHRRKDPTVPRNPLNPDYHLPPIIEPPAEPLKFLRDGMDTSDIPGTHSRPCVGPLRSTANLDASDIEGTTPGWKPPRRAYLDKTETRTAQLDVSDITGPKPEMHPAKNIGNAARNVELVESARVGTIQNLQWKQGLGNERRKIADEAKSRREAATAVLSSLSPTTAADIVCQLGKEFETLDRDRSGKLKSHEVVSALKSSGLTSLTDTQLKTLATGMAVERDAHGGLVDYRKVLAGVYQQGASSNNSMPQKPDWMAARERREKAGNVAAVMTSHDGTKNNATVTESHGKKIHQQEEVDPLNKGSYWFSENTGWK